MISVTKRNLLALVICGGLFLGCTAPPTQPTQQKTPQPTAIIDSTNTPTPAPTPTQTLEPTAEPVNELEGAELPPGFSLTKYTDNYRPTSLTFDAHGNLFVASSDKKIRVWIDENGDGVADNSRRFAQGFDLPLGLAIHPETGDVYLSYIYNIAILKDHDGDLRADDNLPFVSGLPAGRHQNNNLKFGPDGMLYMGLGSTCDACDEEDPVSATIMRYNPDTGEGEVFATGLRNVYDLAFHPETGDLFATENGRDDLGPDSPFEELNHIVLGGDYGWQNCWNELEGSDCEDTIPAIGFFEAHSSANSMDFYDADQFPEEYHLNIFVTIFGTWLHEAVPTGIKRIKLIPDGDTYRTEIEWFVKFPKGGMPLGLIVGPDGALYVGDYIQGAIYRISYVGQ
ncbi:MAG: PQQ-dependent sugar dehydrogenase [Chloroflexota bacterium]